MATELRIPVTGETVDGYVVGELIHEGGMSRIYRAARHDALFPLAIKVPRAEFGDPASCLLAFDNEQMILAAGDLEGAPRFVARGPSADRPYLVLEYVGGESLAAWARRAPLAATEIARLMAPVAAALHQLHRQELVHHDLKPDNILFADDGRTLILDYGLARHRRLPDLVGEESVHPLGTGAYLAPEQLAGGRGDPRSDLFAFGVILYRLATGDLPFGEAPTKAACRRRLFLDPVPPRMRTPSVPEWLDEVILRCLERDPADRYPSASQLAHDLAHPELIPSGGRARGGLGNRPWQVAARWLSAQWTAANPPGAHSPAGIAQVLIALDFAGSDPALLDAIADEARRLAAAGPCRLSCVSVCEHPAGADDGAHDALAETARRQALIELRHWTGGLGLPPSRLRHLVLDGGDPAAAILEFASRHHADLIVVGARGSSGLRRLIGSVSARVAAEAGCSVHIIRKTGPAATPPNNPKG